MNSLSELTVRGKLIEVLRWLCVLPAAVLGDIAALFVIEAVVQIASYVGWGSVGDSNIACYLRLLFFYVPPKAAFVIAGAKTAPRRQGTIAIVLALFGLLLSLMTHVIVQHLDGKRVGVANYTHLVAESAGVIGGAAYSLLQIRRARKTDMNA